MTPRLPLRAARKFHDGNRNFESILRGKFSFPESEWYAGPFAKSQILSSGVSH